MITIRDPATLERLFSGRPPARTKVQTPEQPLTTTGIGVTYQVDGADVFKNRKVPPG